MVAIAAAGTGGHIYPGLAVAQQLRRLEPGVGVVFLTTRRGLGRELLARAGEQVQVVEGQPAPFGLSWRLSWTVWAALRGTGQALGHLRRAGARAVLATGGYGSVPVALAARLAGIPVVWHEQNAWPGRATRLGGRLAQAVALGYEEAARHLAPSVRARARVVGNPVRAEIGAVSREEGARRLGLDPGRPTVLVVGASQGARRLNRAVVEAAGELARLEPAAQVLVSTGTAQFEEVADRLEGLWPGCRRDGAVRWGRLQVVPYLEDMAAALAACDLAVSRAGAISIAELTVQGVPMVLVPYPYAAEDHQRRNAQVAADRGAAVVVPDEELTGQRLVEVVRQLLQDEPRRRAMALASRSLGRPRAARELAEMVLAQALAGRASPAVAR
ncbi:MAG TPA: undecaprenyldiphospho-muramoylpentapeptide beta-N-acetylglucosaminyltransferase [Limnochordales bacterium]